MEKLVHSYEGIKDKILEAVEELANPVRQTMSPQGRNVIFQAETGRFISTNDGVTIAKHIDSNDEIKSGFIEIIKEAALQTNNRVGDGTSTSILISYMLLKEMFKMVEDDMSVIEIKEQLDTYRDLMVDAVDELIIEADDDVLHNIAKISANNDGEIADKVMEVIDISGTDGLVNIEKGGDETELEIDDGFVVNGGILSPEFLKKPGEFEVNYENVPVLVTDKRLYYRNEVRKIVETVINEGYSDVVVVARDFIGKAEESFSALHQDNDSKIDNILLVKDNTVDDDSSESLSDLALYLNGEIVSESSGELVTKLSFDNFCVAESVKSTPQKTILNREEVENEQLDKHIEGLREKKEENPDDNEVSRRLAAMTNGMVTINVGASTDIEKTESLFRYEDSINAVRSTMKDGALRGGGMSIWTAWNSVKDDDSLSPDFIRSFERVSKAPVNQILDNCDEAKKDIVDKLEEHASPDSNQGYNAQTREIGDLIELGVVDPAKVTKQSINNATSVVKQIITSNYLILQKENEQESKQGERKGGRGNGDQ